MDDFERRVQASGGNPPILVAIFLGVSLGGILGLQGTRLEALAADLHQVLSAPVLGASGPRPVWATPPASIASEGEIDLDRDLSAPWPADRMMIIPDDPVEAPAVQAPPATRADSEPTQETVDAVLPADWQRHLVPEAFDSILKALPPSLRSSALLKAAFKAREPTPSEGRITEAPRAARPAAKAFSQPIDYGAQARGAVLVAGGGDALNFMGGRRGR